MYLNDSNPLPPLSVVMCSRSADDLSLIQFISFKVFLILTARFPSSGRLKWTMFMQYVTALKHMVFNAFMIFLSYNSVLRNDSNRLKRSSITRSFAFSSNSPISFFYAEEFVKFRCFRVETLLCCYLSVILRPRSFFLSCI